MSISLFNPDKGYTVFSGSNYETRNHAHYAIEIVYCTAGSFSVTTDQHHYTDLTNVIIPPNLSHSFSCLHATCDLLFIDPLSHIGRYFMQQYPRNDIQINQTSLSQLYKNGQFDLSQIPADIHNNKIDERILNAINTIEHLFSSQQVTVAQLSGVSFLSEGRLSHLFKKQLGISIHQYILWKKVLLAVQQSRQGYSLTECAHLVGFTDSSHFNRVFYKMFGLTPFFVLRN